MLRRRIGSIVCWSMVVLFVFSSSCGSWIVAAEGSGEPILALTLDGKPAYPTPYMIPSANSSTMNQSPNPSAPSPSAAAPTYWWNQYQDNWYHDGWASADPTYTPTSESHNAYLPGGKYIQTTPIITSGSGQYVHGLAISANADYYLTRAYESYLPAGGWIWNKDNQGTVKNIVSNGLYYWSFAPHFVGPYTYWQLTKYYVDTGEIATPATVDLTMQLIKSPMTYIPSTGSGQENRIYFFGIVAGQGTYLYAFAADTVTYRWATKISTTEWSNWYASPVILSVGSGARPILFGGMDGTVYTYDENGAKWCGASTGAAIYYSASIDRNTYAMMYVLNSAGNLFKYKIEKGWCGSVYPAWKLTQQWTTTVGGSQLFTAPVNAASWVFTKAWNPGSPSPTGKTVITAISKDTPSQKYQFISSAITEARPIGGMVPPSPIVTNGFSTTYKIYFPGIWTYNNVLWTNMRQVTFDGYTKQFTGDTVYYMMAGNSTQYYDINTGIGIAQFPVGTTASAWYVYAHLEHSVSNTPMVYQICLDYFSAPCHPP